MSVELVTGYYGVGEGGKPQRHVSSAEDGARQAGTLGPGCYVLSTGSKLSATMEDANTLVVADGDAIMNGRHVRLTETTSFTIPTGVQGQKMSNVAVLRYQVGSDSVESVTPLVLTGEPSTGEPADPEHNEGSILDGDSPVDMPLYRIVTDGINAGDPEPLFDVLMPMADLWDSVSHRSDINLAASDDRLVAWRVGPVVTVSYLRTADGFWSGSPGQYQRLGTMPEGLRPRADCRAFAFATGGAVEYMYVGVDGSVGFTNIGTAGSTMDGFFGCVISYAVAPQFSVSQLAASRRGHLMDITYPKLQSLAPGAYSVGDGSGSVLGDPSETPQVTGWIIVFSASPHRVSALLSLGQGGSPGVYVTSGVDRDNWVKISQRLSVSQLASRPPRLFTGSKVVPFTASQGILFFPSEYKAIVGRTFSQTRDCVCVMNGDSKANGWWGLSTTYNPENDYLLVIAERFGPTEADAAGNVRVNYIIAAGQLSVSQVLWEGSASSLDVVLPGASEATGLLFDFSVGDRRIGTGVCTPSQGTNIVCAWGIGKDGMTMCRCVFTLSGDRLSWSYGNSNYYAFRTTIGQPLTFTDGSASVVTRISRV